MAERHIVLPGGSGYIGRNLKEALVARGDRVTVLTRGAASSGRGWQSVQWDGFTVGPWSEVLDGADAIVNLFGRRVDCRPTRSNIAELISSRVQPSLVIGKALAGMKNRLAVWVQIASLAIFGEGGEDTIDETTTPSGVGPPQMVQVALAWESAVREAASNLERVVLLRGGICLGGGDPATKRLIGLARWGLGGQIGSGQQWVSWVSVTDLINVILRAIDLETMSGLYHVTSPNPVRNAEMMETYRKLAGRRWGLRSSVLMTKIGAPIMGSDHALALTGRRVIPARLLDEGYRFRYPHFAEVAHMAVTAALKTEVNSVAPARR